MRIEKKKMHHEWEGYSHLIEIICSINKKQAVMIYMSGQSTIDFYDF